MSWASSPEGRLQASGLVVEEAGDVGQGRLEAFQRADITLAGRGLLDAEEGGDLVVAQLLEMPKRQHLAVDRVEAIEGRLELRHGLAADRGQARRGVLSRQARRQAG